MNARYPKADTRTEEYRRVIIEDALALSSPTEAVAILTEAIRKAFSPAAADGIYRALGAAAEERT